MIRSGNLASAGNSVIGSQASLMSELYNEDDLGSNFDTFRGRTLSNVSNIGASSSRVSPTVEPTGVGFEEFDFPPWGMDSSAQHPQVNELMSRTDQMRLDNAQDSTFRHNLVNGQYERENNSSNVSF